MPPKALLALSAFLPMLPAWLRLLRVPLVFPLTLLAWLLLLPVPLVLILP